MAMSNEKLAEVLDLYEAKASELILHAELHGSPTVWQRQVLEAANKVKSMIPTCRDFLREGRREKLMRWLGFMQGAWWITGIYTVDDLKRHNMPPGEEFKGVA